MHLKTTYLAGRARRWHVALYGTSAAIQIVSEYKLSRVGACLPDPDRLEAACDDDECGGCLAWAVRAPGGASDKKYDSML